MVPLKVVLSRNVELSQIDALGRHDLGGVSRSRSAGETFVSD
jgi:hypothetical protein